MSQGNTNQDVHDEKAVLQLHVLALREALDGVLGIVTSGQMDEHIVRNARLALDRTDPAGVFDPIIVQIGLEGGFVQGATSNYPLEVVVLDYDTDSADDVVEVPQSGDKTTDACVSVHTALVDKAFIQDVRRLMEES